MPLLWFCAERQFQPRPFRSKTEAVMSRVTLGKDRPEICDGRRSANSCSTLWLAKYLL